jgi:hypothetical protein
MSAEEPTTPEERTTKVSPEETWNALEGRTGGAAVEDEGSAPSQVGPEHGEKGGRRPVFSRRAGLLVAVVLAVLAVALAATVVVALVGGGSGHRPGPRSGEMHAKGRTPDRRRSSRARWAEEADGRRRSRQRRNGHERLRAERHAYRRRKPRRPAKQSTDAPSQPPAYGPTSPESAPEPSAPAPAAPSAPKERPSLRDGATESTEFGL